MSGYDRRALWALVVLLGVPAALLMGLATHTAAWLSHPPELGPPLLESPALYSPLAPFRWMVRFRGTVLARRLGLGLLVVVAATVLALLPFARLDGGAARSVHGSSRHATLAELRRAGLLARRGILLGAYRGRTVRTESTEHVLAILPTRAGKTSCWVIPNVLELDGNLVVSDLKGAEIFTASAGAKARTHDVYRFEPAAGDTATWNPLDEIPRDDDDVAALQRQATDFIVPERSGTGEHWIRAARQLHVCLGLHVIYAAQRPGTLAAARELLLAGSAAGNGQADDKLAGDPRAPFTAILEEPCDPAFSHRWPEAGRHPEAAALARRFLATAPRELASILSTLSTFYEPWGDPRIDRATSSSTFSLSRLDPGHERPAAVYLIVPRADVERLSPLLRMLYAGLANRLTRVRRYVDVAARVGVRRTYLILDEFPLLGYMPQFATMISTLAGYGATLMICVQDLATLRNLYGPHEPITGGCPIQIAGATQRPETLRHLSQLAGEATVHWQRATRTTAGGLGRSSRSVSPSEARRPLLTVGEVRTLPADKAVLFAPGVHPVVIDKRPYFRDRRLRALARLAPPAAAHPGAAEER